MSDNMRRMHLDMQEIRIKAFIRAKRHLPETNVEFYQWLKEFEDSNLKFIKTLIDGMEEFQQNCMRPLVISRTNLNDELNLAAKLNRR